MALHKCPCGFGTDWPVKAVTHKRNCGAFGGYKIPDPTTDHIQTGLADYE